MLAESVAACIIMSIYKAYNGFARHSMGQRVVQCLAMFSNGLRQFNLVVGPHVASGWSALELTDQVYA